MKPLKNHFLFWFFFLVSFSGYSQIQALYNQSVEAYKAKDFVLFLKRNQQMDSIRPMHPTVLYNLAAAYSLNNQPTEAVATLKKLVVMDNSVVFEEDADFELIRNTSGFEGVKALKAAQNTSVASSVKKFSLSEKDLHPEGLVYLEKQKLWLAGSIRNKKIVSFDSKGICSDWFTDSRYSVFALKTDPSQKYIWAATSAMPEMKGYSKAVAGQNQILKIEIATRKIVKSYSMQGKHIFSDLLVAKNGEVYISDSEAPLIYIIKNDALTVWKDLNGMAYNLQGLAFNNDQSKLFVADYIKGIAVIPMKNDSIISWLSFPEGTTTKGIDGLVYYKNSLIAIQNGAVPIRIVKYQLNAESSKINSFTVLDNNREAFNEPALASISNGKMYFFANSPWRFYNAAYELDLSKFENPQLFELRLD